MGGGGKHMNVGNAYHFLVITLGLIFSLTAKANDHQGQAPAFDSSQETEVEQQANLKLTAIDLRLYLELLNQREQQLKAANDALLKNANYSLVKIPVFLLKAALDGYLTAQMGGTSKAAEGVTRSAIATSPTVSANLISWIKAGGVAKMKTLGFNVGVLGITAATNSAIQPTFRWQYVIPIYGNAYSAYLWSDQLMNSSELIKKNGNDLIEIRREKQRIRSILEKSSD